MNFQDYAQLEKNLSAEIAVAVARSALTKTQRRAADKSQRRTDKPALMTSQDREVAAPDRTVVRLSCLPHAGRPVVKEFRYYTPFASEATSRAVTEAQLAGSWKFITVLEVTRL